jgi:hypothetical protein
VHLQQTLQGIAPQPVAAMTREQYALLVTFAGRPLDCVLPPDFSLAEVSGNWAAPPRLAACHAQSTSVDA